MSELILPSEFTFGCEERRYVGRIMNQEGEPLRTKYVQVYIGSTVIVGSSFFSAGHNAKRKLMTPFARSSPARSVNTYLLQPPCNI